MPAQKFFFIALALFVGYLLFWLVKGGEVSAARAFMIMFLLLAGMGAFALGRRAARKRRAKSPEAEPRRDGDVTDRVRAR